MHSSLLDLDPGPLFPEALRMIVEVPKDSSNKYEYDPNLGVFRIDRVLYSPIRFPGDYGFAPGTIAEDGEPLDVLTLVELASFSGCLLEVRPVGLLKMVDEGEPEQKILAVPARDPRYDQVRTFEHIGAHVLKEIEHFFAIYKELEGKSTEMQGWQGIEKAYSALATSREHYLELR